ncbi:HNH endonuclease signature motif containing protein [Saccharopolyspora sp. NPDC002376]
MAVTIDFDDLKRGILLGEEGMPGTLATTEQSISAENVRRIACDCEVLPVMLGGDSLPLDVGASQRTTPPHIRAALLQRDGACAFPSCDRPLGTPQAHQIVHWVDGGPTDIGNMVMTCAPPPRHPRAAVGRRHPRWASGVHATVQCGRDSKTQTRWQGIARRLLRHPPGSHPCAQGLGGCPVMP